MKVPPVAMPEELGLAAQKQTDESPDSPQLPKSDQESEAQRPENNARKRVPRRGIRIKSDLMQEQPEETNKDPQPKKNGKD
jgi:hypothetical protein